MVTYGWANQESRLLSLSLDHLESLFECGTVPVAAAPPFQMEEGMATVAAAAVRLPESCDVCFQNGAHLCTDCELGRSAGGQYFGDGVAGDWSACNVKACNFCNIQMGCFTPPEEEVANCQGCLQTAPLRAAGPAYQAAWTQRQPWLASPPFTSLETAPNVQFATSA